MLQIPRFLAAIAVAGVAVAVPAVGPAAATPPVIEARAFRPASSSPRGATNRSGKSPRSPTSPRFPTTPRSRSRRVCSCPPVARGRTTRGRGRTSRRRRTRRTRRTRRRPRTRRTRRTPSPTPTCRCCRPRPRSPSPPARTSPADSVRGPGSVPPPRGRVPSLACLTGPARRRHSMRLVRPLIAVAAAALLISACGGGERSATTTADSAAPTTTAATPRSVTTLPADSVVAVTPITLQPVDGLVATAQGELPVYATWATQRPLRRCRRTRSSVPPPRSSSAVGVTAATGSKSCFRSGRTGQPASSVPPTSN